MTTNSVAISATVFGMSTQHDPLAEVMCECDSCTFAVREADQEAADWAFYPIVGRCEDAPCCGCCEKGLL